MFMRVQHRLRERSFGEHVLQNQYDLASYKFHIFYMKQIDFLYKLGHKDCVYYTRF